MYDQQREGEWDIPGCGENPEVVQPEVANRMTEFWGLDQLTTNRAGA